jgi:hypothetical protein
MFLTLPALLLLAAAEPPAAAPRPGLFISPMGEPFRSPAGPGTALGAWIAGADTNKDGALSRAEAEADAARFYATLDVNSDGEIDPAELTRYESEVAPEIQLGRQMGTVLGHGRRRGGERGWGKDGRESEWEHATGGYEEGLEGAGRYSFLNIPEPVISADLDLNRGVSRAEFVQTAGQRFLMLDRNHDGRLTRAELPPLPQPYKKSVPLKTGKRPNPG